MIPEGFTTAVLEALRAGQVHNKDDLHRVKQRLTKQYALGDVPRDADLLQTLSLEDQDRYRSLLVTKPMRSGSGVAIIAIMTSPAACPHGKCIYCPGGPDVGVPQSYTGFEPSTMRSARLDYDPYRVMRSRLAQLEYNGHAIDKLDVVLQGGTFPARDPAYQDWVIANVYAGANHGPDSDPASYVSLDSFEGMSEEERFAAIQVLQEENESASCRIIGLTIETKPDWCLEAHLDRMLRYGCTRIELGVQTLNEEVQRRTNRGHGLAETVRSLQLAKDTGFKICVHMMPGLPGNTPESDIEEYRVLYEDPRFRPDMLKIYPTLIVAEGETTLKKWWREGRYQPLDTETAAWIVAHAKDHIPRYCRIQRVDRDIPTTHVLAGVDKSNLRQLAIAKRRELGKPDCLCIRCRELIRSGGTGDEVLSLRVSHYASSGGDEWFLEYVEASTDRVAAFLRLRHIGPDAHQIELRGTYMVRELKVYGMAVPLGQASGQSGLQHRGLGGQLLDAAHDLIASRGGGTVHVISGVGVKPYYRRKGYLDSGPYLAREVEIDPEKRTASGIDAGVH